MRKTLHQGKRRRLAPLLETLEERQLLTASPLSNDYQDWRQQSFSIGDVSWTSIVPPESSANSSLSYEDWRDQDVSLGDSVGAGADVGTQDAQSGSLIRLDQAQSQYPYRGEGYSVVVIDTGIDYNHSALGGGWGNRVIAGYDFVDNDADPMDLNGHGTHVAGIIGSSNAAYMGIAPNVNLIALRVLDAAGSGTFGAVEDALRWVINNQSTYNIASINMSLGSGNYASNPFGFLEDEFATLNSQGVFISVASGNSFYTYNSNQGLGYPAISNSVVAVGAVYDANVGSVTWSSGARDNTTAADRITSFTQRGPGLDILAPGAMIASTARGGGYVSMGGTSMAAPMIAGAAAIIRQALDSVGQSASANQAGILSIMQQTGVTINDGDNEDDNVVNTGLNFKRLDLLAALDSIGGSLTTLDDGGVGYSETGGGWSGGTTSAASAYLGDLRWANSGTGNNVATWNFGNIANGTYEIQATWMSYSDRATNSPYRVYDGNTLDATFRVNQQANSSGVSYGGRTWQSLGQVTVQNGSLRVTLADDANGFVIADGVRIVAAPPAPEVTVTVSGNNVVDGNGTVINFGELFSGQSSTQTFTIQNTGTATLTLGSLSAPVGFQIASGLGSTSLAAGQSTTFAVRFDAASAGTYSGTLSFVTNDADEGTFNFTIAVSVVTNRTLDDGGTGYSETGSGWGGASTSTSLTYLGDTRWANSGTGNNVATWNFGSVPNGTYEVFATWFGFSDRAANAPYRIYDGNTLDATYRVSQQVDSSGVSFGGRNWQSLGQVAVDNGSIRVTLADDASGYVLADGVRIVWVPPAPEVSVSVDSANVADGTSSAINFGELLSGQVVTKTFTVNNVGTLPLTLANLSVPSGFQLVSGFGASTVNPGQSTTFAVRFSAASAGTYSGTLSFVTNDADETVFDFPLTVTVVNSLTRDDGGTGYSETGSGWGGASTSTSLTYLGDTRWANSGTGNNVATWNFGSVPNGTYEVFATWFGFSDRASNAPYRVYDGNTLDATYRVSQQVDPTGVSFGERTWQSLGQVAIDNGSIRVTLADDASGYVLADGVRIVWIPPAPEVSVSVDSGNVADGTSSAINFGELLSGQVVTKTFTVNNVGTLPLTLANLSVPSGFQLVSGFGASTVNPGQSTTFSVRFSAASAGTYSGTLSFVTNDADETVFDFPLTVSVVNSLTRDDGGTGYSETGSGWGGGSTSTSLTYLGDTRWANSGTGNNVATWNFGSVPNGTYEVFATWFGFSDRAANAPYRIYDGNTLDATYRVSQQVDSSGVSFGGRNWQSLGQVAVDNGSIRVTLADDASGYVLADGVRIVWIPPAPEVSVSVDSGNVADGTSSAINFGELLSGQVVTKTFTVNNVGTLPLTLANLSVPSGFQLVSGFGSSTVNPGQFTTFSVRYTASAVGTYSGTLSFVTNDADETVFDFPLTVSVVNSLTQDDGGSGYSESGSGWGGGSTSSSLTYLGDTRWANTGTGNNVATWNFGSVPNGRYEIFATWFGFSDRASNAPYRVYDGNSLDATYRVSQQVEPTGVSIGGRTWQSLGQVAVDNGSIRVTLADDANGYVLADGVRIVWVPPNPEINVSVSGVNVADGTTTPVNFGELLSGQTVSRTFTITNTGTENLTLSNLSVPVGFSLAWGFGTPVVTPGSTTSFAVTFSAASAGTYSGTVSFLTNDADETFYDFPISVSVVTALTIDDGGSGYSESGSGWGGGSTSTSTTYLGDTRWANSGTGNNVATWNFGTVPNGTYEIFATWYGYSDRASNAPYRVYDGNTLEATHRISQQVDPSGVNFGGRAWRSIGQVTVDNGSLRVTLADDANGYVLADGVRIARVLSNSAGESPALESATIAFTTAPTITPSALDAGSWSRAITLDRAFSASGTTSGVSTLGQGRISSSFAPAEESVDDVFSNRDEEDSWDADDDDDDFLNSSSTRRRLTGFASR